MMNRVFSASNSVLSGAFVIAAAGLLSRLLGLYRDRLLATTFGAGPSLDAYYAAFRIPDFMFHLLVLGALSAGFIPLFTEYLQVSKEKAYQLAQSVLTLLSVSLILLCSLLFVFSPQLAGLVAPGFDAQTANAAAHLTRIMLLSPILLGISAVFGGVLQSYRRFLAYSIAPILYNAGIIFSIFFLAGDMGIDGVAWGVILGAGLHLIWQFVVAMKIGWVWQLKRFWQPAGIKEIIRLMGPRALSLMILQLNLLVMTIFASKLSSGSVSIFNFANNLAHVPVGLFGISFAVSVFPFLSEQAAQKDVARFTDSFWKTFVQILFFVLPSLVLFILLDEQIVRLVYGAGEFDWQSTLTTARALLYLVPAMLAQSLLPLLTRSFYARKDTLRPFYAAAGGLLVTSVCGWFFTREAGASVELLSLAYSLGSLAQAGFLLYHEYPALSWVKETIFALLLAAAAMVLTLQTAKIVTGPFINLLTVRGVFFHFLIPVFAGTIAYLGFLKHAHLPLYEEYEKTLIRRLRLFERRVLPEVAKGEEDLL